MAGDLLSDLYDRIGLDPGFRLDESVIQQPSVGELFEVALGSSGLTFTSYVNKKLENGRLVSGGTVDIFGMKDVYVLVEFWELENGLTGLGFAISTTLRAELAAIQSSLFGGGFHLPKQIGAFRFSSCRLSFVTAEKKNGVTEKVYTVAFTAQHDGDIDFGAEGIQLEGPTITITGDLGKGLRDIQGEVEGTINIGSVAVTVTGVLAADFELKAQVPELEFGEAVNGLPGPGLAVPDGFPEISLPEVNVLIRFVSDIPVFVLWTEVPHFGHFVLAVQKLGAEWEFAAAFVLPKDWKFASLAECLAPLDLFVIRPRALCLASFEEQTFHFPALNGNELTVAVKDGLSLEAKLVLEKLGLELLRTLLKPVLPAGELPLSLEVGASLADALLVVRIGEALDIIPTVLRFEQFALVLDPDPLSVLFTGSATVTVFGNRLPLFTVSVGLSETTQRIMMETQEPWDSPFGVKNLTINKLVLQLQFTPTTSYGVYAEILLGGKTLEFALLFSGGMPNMVYAKFDGEISLRDAVRELVRLDLPSILFGISLSDVIIYFVLNPLGETIGTHHFDPGLVIGATLRFVGLGTTGLIRVDPEKGVYVKGALEQMVKVDNLLLISNETEDGPPSMELDSSKPLLEITGKASLLGITQSIAAHYGGSSLSFALARQIGASIFALNCTFSGLRDFDATGTFSSVLHAEIGPVQLFPGGPSLGKVVLDSGFTGGLALHLHGLDFAAEITGFFSFLGIRFDIPKITMTVVPSSYEDILKAVLEAAKDLVTKELANQSSALFKQLFETAEKWLKAIADGIIDVAKDAVLVALALKEVFKQTAEWIGRAVRDVLKWGSAAAARGLKAINETVESIAKILKGLGDKANEIAKALKVGAGEAVESIARALSAVGENINDIAVALRIGAEFAADAVAKALREQLGQTAGAIAKGLSQAGDSVNTIAVALRKGADFAAGTVAKALKEQLNQGAGAIAKGLYAAGDSVNTITTALRKEAGFAARVVALALKKELRQPAAAVANALSAAGDTVEVIADALRKGAGFGVVPVAKVLKEQLNQGAHSIAKFLDAAGDSVNRITEALLGVRFNAVAVAKAIKEQLNQVADAIAGALRAANVLTKDIALALRDGAGETATTIAKAFKEHLLEPAGRIAEDLQGIGTDVNEIAKALKEGAGEGADAVARVLKEALDITDNKVIARALQGAEYAGQEVVDALAFIDVAGNEIVDIVGGLFPEMPIKLPDWPDHVKFPDHLKVPDHIKHIKVW